MTEGFEGAFPTGKWRTYGNPTWNDDDCRAFTGGWSAWCAGSALDPCPWTLYPGNLNSWMTWGPFDLSDATAGELDFWYWLSSEAGYDTLFWGSSSDGTTFYGDRLTGPGSGWWPGHLDLCDHRGDPTVWIGFRFCSDAAGGDLGAFVDDIVVQKRTDGQPDLTWYVPPGWTDAIVISSRRGTNTSDPLEVGDTAFVDVAWQNSGSACAGFHDARLLSGPAELWMSLMSTLEAGYYLFAEDIPYPVTATGTHQLRLVIDRSNWVPESNEANNTCDLLFDAGCWPGPVVGSGCSVVPGVSHPSVRANCSGSEFELADWSRIPSFTNCLKSKWFYDAANLRTFTDRDNIWNDSSARQCQGVDAHVYSGLTYDYMRDVLGLNSYDDAGAGMTIAVDNPASWQTNNSGWDTLNSFVAIGLPGPGRRSLAGSLDVVAHEWGHAMTRYTSNLVPEKESGALSESFSDMLGVSVGFAFTDPDYLLGEDSYSNVDAMRSMENPIQYHQPDTYKGPFWVSLEGCTPDTNSDWCWIHTNSGVPNKMFYLLSHGGTHNGITVTGIGVQQAMYIMYWANANTWRPPSLTLYGAFEQSVQAANDIDPSGFWGRQVTRAWGAVKVCDCPLQGDINADLAIDVIDVGDVIGIAYSGDPDPQDAACPTTRCDVNNDGTTDTFDVIYLIATAFSGGPNPIDPCAP